jgi:hypothetical protein
MLLLGRPLCILLHINYSSCKPRRRPWLLRGALQLPATKKRPLYPYYIHIVRSNGSRLLSFEPTSFRPIYHNLITNLFNSSSTPGVFCTYFYNHARRLRFEKLLYNIGNGFILVSECLPGIISVPLPGNFVRGGSNLHY